MPGSLAVAEKSIVVLPITTDAEIVTVPGLPAESDTGALDMPNAGKALVVNVRTGITVWLDCNEPLMLNGVFASANGSHGGVGHDAAPNSPLTVRLIGYCASR